MACREPPVPPEQIGATTCSIGAMAAPRCFHKDDDFAAFLRLFEPACERLPMRIVGWCLLPNHFHLVLWPRRDRDLGRWMQWLLTSHVRRYHRHYHGSGHVWQGRFKAFPIQRDEHFLTVLRYVERNALRAGLVEQAEDWPWSSLRARQPKAECSWLAASPVALPRDWTARVNRALSEAELAAVRRSVARRRRTARRAGRRLPPSGWAWKRHSARAAARRSAKSRMSPFPASAGQAARRCAHWPAGRRGERLFALSDERRPIAPGGIPPVFSPRRRSAGSPKNPRPGR